MAADRGADERRDGAAEVPCRPAATPAWNRGAVGKFRDAKRADEQMPATGSGSAVAWVKTGVWCPAFAPAATCCREIYSEAHDRRDPPRVTRPDLTPGMRVDRHSPGLELANGGQGGYSLIASRLQPVLGRLRQELRYRHAVTADEHGALGLERLGERLQPRQSFRRATTLDLDRHEDAAGT